MNEYSTLFQYCSENCVAIVYNTHEIIVSIQKGETVYDSSLPRTVGIIRSSYNSEVVQNTGASPKKAHDKNERDYYLLLVTRTQ